ncbi:MAG: hypothetical protein M1827_001556 [Pycnora praestabilis]|nr:MAG: hypothetical protein M1827_001556 [Pycnora praestabilis]
MEAKIGGPGSKGGDPRGGPKRWTVTGPKPAGHVPWPEVFKHHISVVEGHLRMLEMIQKHTIPYSGNWNTIAPMVDRTKDMLHMAKTATRSFVPPKNDRQQVPLGSSFQSIYPGYSPADLKYGEATMEAGQAIAQARAKGMDMQRDPNGPRYEVAQAHGKKRKLMSQQKKDDDEKVGMNGDGAVVQQATAEESTEGGIRAEGNGDNSGFFIDTKPTSVNIPTALNPPTKRTSMSRSPAPSFPEPVRKKQKKSKTEPTTARNNGSAATPQVEFEDISAEVDARLKEREAKRSKLKNEERKRRRESGDLAEAPIPVEVTDAATAAVESKTAAPPKKKKKVKKSEDEEATAGEAEVKKDKTNKGKRLNSDTEGKEDAAEGDAGAEGVNGNEGSEKKKRKENKTGDGALE